MCQIPIIKSQVPNNFQFPESNPQMFLEFWSSGLGVLFVVIGAWNLVLNSSSKHFQKAK
jgi:hypothetical protein